MINKLPEKGSKKWLWWMLIYGFALALLFWINRFLIIGQGFELVFAFRFLLLAFGIAFVVNGIGWLGGRWIWLITSLGTVIGLILMYVYSFGDLTGWEDLISIIAFGQGVLVGFLVGLVVEIVVYLLRRKRE